MGVKSGFNKNTHSSFGQYQSQARLADSHRRHTDDVGDDKSNQQLSLKRAESVRDWMRDTGDVAESCFAVQGYGELRPYKTNDTPEGRAANRRVEISLVPQADACRVSGMKEPSPQGGDALTK